MKPAAPAIEKIKVKVDGREIEVPRLTADWSGKLTPTTMIQACELAKTDVPHYCWHPKLPVAGNCRMCLVEFGTPALGPDRKPMLNPDGTPKIAKSPRPAIACATPISPGMEIYTTTPGVKQMREGVLEFLLINHPLDCPICDEAGECKLQEYSVDYGQSASRFVEAKVHKPKAVDLGPRIMLDAERCILCSRCIRFTRDIAGDDSLGFINRGSYSTLTHYPSKPFDNNYTLNTVDICPVGALTSKDFRFKMRVWFLKETKSLCTSCGTGCNAIIGSREEKNLPLHAARKQRRQWSVDVRCRSFELQVDWSCRPFERCFGARPEIHLDGGAQRNFRQTEKNSGRFRRDCGFCSSDE
jgi:NADH-quinone oxidoreductase subunit G